MKQKIVIRVLMHCHKCHSKALKIAVGMSGVESVELTGEYKDHIVVVGDEIDSVELTRQLRKKVAHAELESVGAVKKEEKPAAPAQPLVLSFQPPANNYHYCQVISEPIGDPLCIIM